jgi:putative peptidoglycan lipid II flippase
VARTTAALLGYGVGLSGIVAIKVLAPGYYAKHDMRTPVRIAVCVLVLTQVLNFFLVPHLQHAALTLSIGIGALLNALWLLVGLLRAGLFRPLAGWPLFVLRVLLASLALGGLLYWGAHHFDWIALRAQPLMRIGLLAAFIVGAAVCYFGVLLASGMNLRRMLRQ